MGNYLTNSVTIRLSRINFLLCLYRPILGLGRHHETFRFISVTRSRTVGWTPWTCDQFVARPLLTTPGDCEDGEVGGMKRFVAGEIEVFGENLTRRHFFQHKSHLPDPGANPCRRGGKPATNRFSYEAALSTVNISCKLVRNYTHVYQEYYWY
jgi:hypothetical protein